MAEPITIDELLAAMEAASQSSNVPGLTSAAIAKSLNWSIYKTRRLIREAIAAGKIKSAQKPIIAINGQPNITSVYYPARKPADSPAKILAAGRAAKASTKGAKRK